MKLRIETNFQTMLFIKSFDFKLLMGKHQIKNYQDWLNYLSIYKR